MRWLPVTLAALALGGGAVRANDGIGPPAGFGGSTTLEDGIQANCTYDSPHGDPVTAVVYALAGGVRVPYIQAEPVAVHPGAHQTLVFRLVAHIDDVPTQGVQTQQVEFVLRDAGGAEFYSVKYPWLVGRPRGWPSYWFDDRVQVDKLESPSDTEMDLTVSYQNFWTAQGLTDKSLCVYVLKGGLRIPWIGSEWVPMEAGRHTIVIPVRLGTPCPLPLDNPYMPAPGPIQTTGFQIQTVARTSGGAVVTTGSSASGSLTRNWPAPPPTKPLQLKKVPTERLKPVLKK